MRPAPPPLPSDAADTADTTDTADTSGAASSGSPAGRAPNGLPASLSIPARFNGPRSSGNGGWAGGLLAAWLPAGPVSVALRAPVPLDTALALRMAGGGALQLCAPDGGVVAEASPGALVLDLPALPSVAQAEAAGALGRLAQAGKPADSAYAHCFVCGFLRGDGLRLAPGPIEGRSDGLVATTWVPAAELAGLSGGAAAGDAAEAADGTADAGNADDAGAAGAAARASSANDAENTVRASTAASADAPGPVSAAAVWAALDCPAGIAWSTQLPPGSSVVTVGMTVAIDHPLHAGQRYRVLAWPISRDGRKLHAGSALVDDAGRVCARSRQLWLMPRDTVV